MAIIPLPAKFGFTKVNRFALVRNSNTLRSRFTGQGQRVTYPYAVWEFEGDLVEYDGPQAGAIRAFFASLDGVENTFKLPVPGYTKPSTGFVGILATNAAAASRATSLSVGSDQASKPLFNVGDFFTINDELKLVTDAVALNAGSAAVINFKPALRKPVTANTSIIFNNPYCLMHAVEDDVASWGIAPPIRQSSSFKAIEAVEI